MEAEPIYRFNLFKQSLESLGIHVGEATGFIAIGGEDVLPEHIQNITFVPGEGIKFNFGDGRTTRVFLYKRRYKLLQYGKPRYHIRNCSTIQDFINSGTFNREYRMANTDEVKVINWDNYNREELVDKLPLCKYCMNIVLNETRRGDLMDFNHYQGRIDNVDSSVYADMLREDAAGEKEVWVDVNGYTDDWPAISYAYRERHNFTCERCGVKMETPMDYRFMQTHHRNGVKTNNSDSNLECLCIECHSQVDAAHRENFSKGANKVMLESFRKKYRK